MSPFPYSQKIIVNREGLGNVFFECPEIFVNEQHRRRLR